MKMVKYLIITISACLLFIFSENLFSQDIKTILQEKDDSKAMDLFFKSFEEKEEKEVNSLVNKFIEECTVEGRENLKRQTVMRLYNVAIPKNPTGQLRFMMANIGTLIGDKAPDFKVSQSENLYDVLKDTTILIFYENTCDACIRDMRKLKAQYNEIEQKGIGLISIGCNMADSPQQPWLYNVADPVGKVYHQYGILKTPTYILLDKDGYIIGRYNVMEGVLQYLL